MFQSQPKSFYVFPDIIYETPTIVFQLSGTFSFHEIMFSTYRGDQEQSCEHLQHDC